MLSGGASCALYGLRDVVDGVCNQTVFFHDSVNIIMSELNMACMATL